MLVDQIRMRQTMARNSGSIQRSVRGQKLRNWTERLKSHSFEPEARIRRRVWIFGNRKLKREPTIWNQSHSKAFRFLLSLEIMVRIENDDIYEWEWYVWYLNINMLEWIMKIMWLLIVFFVILCDNDDEYGCLANWISMNIKFVFIWLNMYECIFAYLCFEHYFILTEFVNFTLIQTPQCKLV